MPKKRYVVRHRSTNNITGAADYNVICLGPTVVSEGLKWIEAEALAKALNEEDAKRVNAN